MKSTRYIIGLFVYMLTACQSQAVIEKDSDKFQIATLLTKQRELECGDLPFGEKTACHLQKDYESTVTSCDESSSSSPAFLCSGIVFRGTASDLDREYYSWNPSPASQKSGGVSFSYLRKDSKFNKLAYGYVTGFIFHPIFYTPDEQDDNIEVLCSYPLDGATDARDNHGCGLAPGYPKGSPCYTQGVITGEQWVQHYNTYGGASNNLHRCGFILEENSSSTNPEQEFMATLKAINLLGQASFREQNELRLATWAQNKQDIPIQAFFYLAGSSEGLASSQKDQKDFFEFSNESRIIPIIRVTLPMTQSVEARFEYIEREQVYIK